jgi:hypothetical protein
LRRRLCAFYIGMPDDLDHDPAPVASTLMRLRSDIWVAAYLRRCAVQGVVAVLRRRGAAEAGAIFVKVDRLDGKASLYGPAPQSANSLPPGIDRLFIRLHAADALSGPDVEARLKRETQFDSDMWIVEIEDRNGRSFLDLTSI